MSCWTSQCNYATKRRSWVPRVSEKRAGAGRSQAKVRAVEKHSGIPDAIAPEFWVGQRGFTVPDVSNWYTS